MFANSADQSSCPSRSGGNRGKPAGSRHRSPGKTRRITILFQFSVPMLLTPRNLRNVLDYPRDFDQVVRRKGLTVPQLVQAGIAEGVARRAVGLGPLGK